MIKGCEALLSFLLKFPNRKFSFALDLVLLGQMYITGIFKSLELTPELKSVESSVKSLCGFCSCIDP